MALRMLLACSLRSSKQDIIIANTVIMAIHSKEGRWREASTSSVDTSNGRCANSQQQHDARAPQTASAHHDDGNVASLCKTYLLTMYMAAKELSVQVLNGLPKQFWREPPEISARSHSLVGLT